MRDINEHTPGEDLIIKAAVRLLVPFAQLFGLYVVVHGHYSPGGGFQAGVIFAAAFVLYGLVFGIEALKRVAHPALLQACAAMGILLYAGTGVAGLLMGNQGRELAMSEATRHHLDTFWELVDEVLNAVLFVWIGL